jgi:Kdo2-lipid IVA lauroyltransferase/acyltransferase
MSSRFKLRRFPPFQLAAFAVARAGAALVMLLPTRMAVALGRFFGRALGRVHPRRRLALEQIAEASGMPRDPKEIAAIVSRMFGNIGVMLVECLHASRMVRNGTLAKRSRFENADALDRALEAGRGAIIVVGHQMNWEMAALLGAQRGYRLTAIARPIENPWLDRFVAGLRTRHGIALLTKYESIGTIGDVLKRNGVLILLADQDGKSGGAFVPFFGRPASTVRGPALLSLRRKAPIIPAEIWREPDGTHVARFSEALDPAAFGSGREAVVRLTAAFTARIEEFVRRHPDQWMWMHRRWKSRPAPSPAPEEARVDA